MWWILTVSSFMYNLTSLITSYHISRWFAIFIASSIQFDTAVDGMVTNITNETAQGACTNISSIHNASSRAVAFGPY